MKASMFGRSKKVDGSHDGGDRVPCPPAPPVQQRSSIVKSQLRHAHSAPSLTALNYNTYQDDDDEVMEEYVMPLRDENDRDEQSQEPKMRRSVSFSNLGLEQVRHIESRENLLERKGEIWFGLEDIREFAKEEISRRRDMGMSSTSMLCSTVPAFDDDDDDDDHEMEEAKKATHGFHFSSPTDTPPSF